MGRKLINIRIELDRETDFELDEWSHIEERSKRRHGAVLLRKIIALRKTNPQDLVRLGLMDQCAAMAAQ